MAVDVTADLVSGHPCHADADPWLCYAISEREAAELQEMLRQLHQRGEVEWD